MTNSYFEHLAGAPPGMQLQHLIVGYWLTQAVALAAELALADLLADGPKSSENLAAATDSRPGALYRLLRTLASIGLFTEHQPGKFALTEMATLLQDGHPQSLRAMARYLASNEPWQSWRNLAHSVRTGEPRSSKPSASASGTTAPGIRS
jgi:hypothetical protein